MKKDKIKSLESFARNGFLAKNEFAVSPDWQSKVIADLRRREYTVKTAAQTFIQTGLAWRFAVASVSIAMLICLALYLTLPDGNSNDYPSEEVTFDNFDNYIEIIAQL